MTTTRLWVDFNHLYDPNHIEVNLDYAAFFDPSRLKAKSEVFLFDGGGHEARGVIARSPSGKRVRVRVIWDSFSSPEDRYAWTYVARPSVVRSATGDKAVAPSAA